MQVVLGICNILILILGLLYSYQTLYIILGLFFTKKFKKAEKFHNYAVVVCARNEEKVIGGLVDSIKKQDYPADKLTVFVVADNCTDNTAKVARQNGAVCYERWDSKNCTKGYALQYLFNMIEKDYGIQSFEAYIMFDADNLLKRDFVKCMNDAFDSGEKIITSYRNTKNLDSNFISAGYALHWVRTSRFTSRARSFLGITTWVQGCGFMFANELVRNGWNFTSLTEDRAFSISAVANGYSISYQHNAEFYDEQPTDMKIAMRQRIRWAKGHLQAFYEYWHILLKGVFTQRGIIKKINCYDMFVTMMPYSIIFIPLKLLKYIATAVIFALACSTLAENLYLIPMFLRIFIFEHFGVIPMALALFILEYRRLAKIKWYKIIYYSLTFVLFGLVGDIATWIAVFSKVTWKPIPHNEDIKIEDVESKVLSFSEKT